MKNKIDLPIAVMEALDFDIPADDDIREFNVEGSPHTYYVLRKGEIYNKDGKLLKYCKTRRTTMQPDLIINIRTPKGKVGNKTFRVKYIIATCFIPNPANYKYVRHIDYNRSNIAASNLMWVATKVATYSAEETSKISAIRAKNITSRYAAKRKSKKHTKNKTITKDYLKPKATNIKNIEPYNGRPKLIMETKEQRKLRIRKEQIEARKETLIKIPNWVTSNRKSN